MQQKKCSNCNSSCNDIVIVQIVDFVFEQKMANLDSATVVSKFTVKKNNFTEQEALV